MESTNSYKNGIPHFDGHKYAFWSIRMKTYIQAQGFEIWKSIVDGYIVQQFHQQMPKQLNLVRIIPNLQMYF
jgi:hypothetical protein